MPTHRPTPHDPIQRLARSIARTSGRGYFAGCAVLGLLSMLALPLLPAGVTTPQRLVIAGATFAYVLLAAWAWRRALADRRPLDGQIVALAMGAVGLGAGLSLMVGAGARSPVQWQWLALLAAVGGLAPRRDGYALLAFCLLLVGGLAVAEQRGLTAAPADGSPLPLLVLFQVLAMVSALLAGRLLARLRQRVLDTAIERERHFRGLLAMAADGYWELDADGRFIRLIDGPRDGAARGALGEAIGRKPWELTQPAFDDHVLDALRADFELRQPFDDLLVQSRGPSGRTRHLTLSGRPRFDTDGSFEGYWGIVRDVTDRIAGERARAASEARYRELFSRSPTPLLLHRRGVVIDANEAAARLLDVDSAAGCRGLDLTTLFAEGDSRDRALQQTEQLERTPVGGSLPVNDFQLVSARNRRLTVQVSSVRVDANGGPATLSIWFDITARVATESALRRSESLLSLLFATSPDLITLTDLATGRYLFVNDAFARLTGWRRDEAVGRTAGELRVWADPEDRQRLVEGVQAHGRVDELAINFRMRTGQLVPMRVSAARFSLDGRDHLVLNARDETAADRVRRENAAMLRNASIGIAFTRDRHFQRVNPFFERMLGWPEGALEGQSGGVVWPDEQAYADVSAAIGPALAEGRAIEIERLIRRRDGSLFLCRILAQALDPADRVHGGTIWICEDVTERRQIEQALAAARDAAEGASRAKSAFLANMSHEIRTPLNGLLGMAKLARQADLPVARREQYLDQIVDSAQGLAGIMSDILDLAKIEAGKIRLEERPFDLREAVTAVHHGYQALAEAKGLLFTLRLADELPRFVTGDAVRLRQILANFVTNAIKFTARGKVEVEAGVNEMGWVHLAVSDTGPGIDADTQQRLFAPFTQADTSTTRRYGGTGLGLSICRELAALMGGEVGLASEPGRGSRFWAALPLLAAEPEPGWADSTDADPGVLRGARVLLVEDNPVNMTVAAAMLQQWGVDVIEAVDGAAALEAADRAAAAGRAVDLVLMDVQMPGMSGHEATRRLRQRWDRRQLPIVALTAAALVSERDEALQAGMNDFLTKPIDGARLREALMRQLSAVAG
jgi:PAS domain S-box-containing protein